MIYRVFLIIVTSLIPFFSSGQDSGNENTRQFLETLEKREVSLKGQPFPSFILRSGKSEVSNKIFSNKISLVNFWFASCRPCLLELKGLNILYDKLNKEKNFQLISFTFEDEKVISDIRKRYNLTFEIISVPYEAFTRLNQGFGSPVNAIVDEEGKIQYWKSGGETSESNALDYILKTIYPMLHSELYSTSNH